MRSLFFIIRSRHPHDYHNYDHRFDDDDDDDHFDDDDDDKDDNDCQ